MSTAYQMKPADVSFANVMIAVEKPPLAFKVGKIGFQLANALKATVTLVHVNPPALLYSTDSSLTPNQMEFQMTQQAEKLLQEVIKHYSNGLKPTTMVLEGQTEQEILRAIRDIEPDLLIIGTHAKKPWKEMLLGSISEDIMRHSDCPVMMIRE